MGYISLPVITTLALNPFKIKICRLSAVEDSYLTAVDDSYLTAVDDSYLTNVEDSNVTLIMLSFRFQQQ